MVRNARQPDHLKHQKKSSCPSCPVLMFRCALLMILALTMVTFLLIVGSNNMISLVDMEEMRERREEEVVTMDEAEETRRSSSNVPPDPSHIHVAWVSCGDETLLNRTLVSIKSVLALARKTVHIHLFVDSGQRAVAERRIASLPPHVQSRFVLSVHPAVYPDSASGREWRALFKPCATLRIFLPTLLPDVDSVVYLDTDTLTLAPIDDLHSLFYKFNKSQLLGVGPEALDGSLSWYKRFARHPYYAPLGVNTGVLLMNLTRMRSSTWSRDVIPIYKQYKMELVYGDQDIINVWAFLQPDKVFDLPCEYNYVHTFCSYGHYCHSADLQGVKVIHGNRGMFLKSEQPAFMRLYQVFEKNDLHSPLREGLYTPLVTAMSQVPKYGCGQVSKLFCKGLEDFVDNIENEDEDFTVDKLPESEDEEDFVGDIRKNDNDDDVVDFVNEGKNLVDLEKGERSQN